MKLVITGALGHIGSKLVRELPNLFSGLEIVMVDDFSCQRYCSLFNLPVQGKYRFIEGDVTTMDLVPVFAGAHGVIHLAAITNAAGSFEIKDKLEKTNFGATQKVANACATLKIPMFYASTTSVYGTQNEVVDEACSEAELKPQSPYAETKLREEALLAQMGIEAGLKFIICRFGTIFGVSPGMRFHTAVNKFCWQAVMGVPITVWKTALHQRRPYLGLNDAVSAVSFVFQKGLFNNQIYNVLTLNATVSEIIENIRANVHELKLEFVDAKIMNQLSYTVSDGKLRQLGFVPNDSIGRGIKETVEMLRTANLPQ